MMKTRRLGVGGWLQVGMVKLPTRRPNCDTSDFMVMIVLSSLVECISSSFKQGANYRNLITYGGKRKRMWFLCTETKRICGIVIPHNAFVTLKNLDPLCYTRGYPNKKKCSGAKKRSRGQKSASGST
jgi:hypothetical protein